MNSADFVAGAMIGRLVCVCVCVCECRELIVVVVSGSSGKGGGNELVTNSRDSFPAGTPRNVIVIPGGRGEASATEGEHEDVVN